MEMKLFRAAYNNLIKPISKVVNTSDSNKIPKLEIEEKHIKNAKLLSNRKELLKLLPKGGVVAELGVDNGDFSEEILQLNKPKMLHLVDYWGTRRYNKNKRRKVEDKFKNETENNRVQLNIGLSTQVVENFRDNYFDWIYIDTDHSYKTTIMELELYRTKIKQGGYIAGHDFIVGNWDSLVRYGVIEAVYEFCKKYNWEIVYVTSELNIKPSFAIKEISN